VQRPATISHSLSSSYNHTHDIALLEESIEVDREALSLRPHGHTDRDTSLGNLAISLRMRYERTGDPIWLDEAISLEREALTLRPRGSWFHLV
jgi:hypothetical protein